MNPRHFAIMMTSPAGVVGLAMDTYMVGYETRPLRFLVSTSDVDAVAAQKASATLYSSRKSAQAAITAHRRYQAHPRVKQEPGWVCTVMPVRLGLWYRQPKRKKLENQWSR